MHGCLEPQHPEQPLGSEVDQMSDSGSASV
jgi:hypothetical protein